MNRFTRRTMLSVALLALTAALPASAQIIRGGNDGWKTPGGGQTTIDLSAYPNVLGSPIVGGSRVSLKGKPLDPNNLGTIDTLLERGQATIGTGGTGTATLKVVALSLESEANINLQDGRQYRLNITLADRSRSGSITLSKANPDGGTFSSSFPVVVKLVFTNTANPNDVLTVNCALSGGCPANTVSSSNSGWATALGGHFDPAAKGVTPIRSGVVVQGYTTVGNNSDFTGGFTASASQNFPPAAISEQDLWAKHQINAPQDCLQTSTTGTAGAARRVAGAAVAQPSPTPAPAVCLAVATPVGD